MVVFQFSGELVGMLFAYSDHELLNLEQSAKCHAYGIEARLHIDNDHVCMTVAAERLSLIILLDFLQLVAFHLQFPQLFLEPRRFINALDDVVRS